MQFSLSYVSVSIAYLIKCHFKIPLMKAFNIQSFLLDVTDDKDDKGK
jgi:hypothetical protein